MDTGTGEQFSLCWNNFHTNLSSGFHSLLKDEDLVDVTLAAEGKFVKAHKTVLSVCSPFFKDLFRVNPCKHPIVILPDVKYGALRSLLHFMYQGEVSVSQEEIPNFMKVAEMLKVKGLTDNADAPNGFAAKKNPFEVDTRHDIQKRHQQSKKLIRPTRPLRPSESPNPIVQPAIVPLLPPKRPHLDSSGTPPPSSSSIQLNPLSQPPPSISPLQDEALSLIKPKNEPLDDEGLPQHSGMDEMQMDLANMLDTQLSGGEPSPSHQIPPWPAPGDMTPVIGGDEASQPELQANNENHHLYHKLLTIDGTARQLRRLCKNCYKKISTLRGRKYARTTTKKVSTYCPACTGSPHLCLECFNSLHKSVVL
ncbi:unnamed protein product [Ceutorhynchus assimilis]|uniref:BTB domain-containing protein n=1 Tax=Ceutorhynchus assimilis TaxID=467358 RepID=A0A9P0DHS4_9CUCU|nr:unnamed protein product [Ceutorhynchus assimilis]